MPASCACRLAPSACVNPIKVFKNLLHSRVQQIKFTCSTPIITHLYIAMVMNYQCMMHLSKYMYKLCYTCIRIIIATSRLTNLNLTILRSRQMHGQPSCVSFGSFYLMISLLTKLQPLLQQSDYLQVILLE